MPHRAAASRPPGTPAARRAGPLALGWAALCALWLAVAPAALHAAPKADLWPRWEKHNDASHLHVDHGAWNDFLERNLISPLPFDIGPGSTYLNYAKVSSLDRAILDRYLQQQAAVPISRYSRKEQKAYWIDLYNALTVQVVLKHYPVKSIRDIDLSSGLFSHGPWDAKLLKVEGVPVSLNDIEHRILRPIWHDPRVHYALNCASRGCPNLAPVAYTVFNTERLLDEGARAFINSPRGVRFEGARLIVSSLYVWYEQDFGGSPAGVLAHLRKYAKGKRALRLATWKGGFDHAYDWSLNAP